MHVQGGICGCRYKKIISGGLQAKNSILARPHGHPENALERYYHTCIIIVVHMHVCVGVCVCIRIGKVLSYNVWKVGVTRTYANGNEEQP